MKSRPIIAMALLTCCTRSQSDPVDITPEDAVPASHVVASSSASTAPGNTGGAGGLGGEGGGTPPGAGDTVSSNGTRLLVVSYAGSDGSRFVRADAYDALLGTYCTFETASDGLTRCLPSVTTTQRGLDGSLFIDDSCTRPAIEFKACDAVGVSHVTTRSASSSTCPPYTHTVYRLGAERPDSAFLNVGGDCIRYAELRAGYAEAIVVDPGEFVHMSLSVATP